MTLNVDKAGADDKTSSIDGLGGCFTRYSPRWAYLGDVLAPKCQVTVEPWISRSVYDSGVLNKDIKVGHGPV